MEDRQIITRQCITNTISNTIRVLIERFKIGNIFLTMKQMTFAQTIHFHENIQLNAMFFIHHNCLLLKSMSNATIGQRQIVQIIQPKIKITN